MRDGTVTGTVGVILILSLLAAGVGGSQPDGQPQRELTAEDVNMVTVEDNGTARLWPYTSRQKEFSTLTLPINVVVLEDAATTRRVLAGTARWQSNDPEGESVVINGTGVAWHETEGARRYVYVETASGGQWLTETSQLHDGTYLGSRTHMRLYEGGGRNETWTAVQAHTEYWDWFRLRHSVGSLAKGQTAVEHDLYGTGLIDGISRERYGNGGILDADGWVTVIDLVDWKVRPTGPTGDSGVAGPIAALAPLAVGLAMAVRDELFGTGRRVGRTIFSNRLTRFHLALFVATALALPAVRFASVALELRYPGLSPKLIAAPMYLALAVGLPAAAIALGSRLSADDGFVVAFVGFGTGILLDYMSVGVEALPVGVVIHRVVLVFAIALVAAGGTRWSEHLLLRHGYRVPGILLWVVGLLWPLFGM